MDESKRVFKASRMTSGNFLFPVRIEITPDRVSRVKPSWIARDEISISIQSVEQRRVLETCASLLAISLERIHYIEVAQASTVQIESERLRNSLLSAISHDLRTPLTHLRGTAELALASPPDFLSAPI